VAQGPISLRAYATWRKNQALQGGSLESVRKAIRSGRLVDSVVEVDGVKKIADPEMADREWAANTDPSRRGLAGFVDTVNEMDGAGGEPPELVKASTRLKKAQADLAELNYRKRAQQLMEVDDAEGEWSEFCSNLRNALLSLPNRLKQRHPDTPLEVLATLDELLRADLEELAGDDDDEAS
jgi:hypothetical protein